MSRHHFYKLLHSKPYVLNSTHLGIASVRREKHFGFYLSGTRLMYLNPEFHKKQLSPFILSSLFDPKLAPKQQLSKNKIQKNVPKILTFFLFKKLFLFLWSPFELIFCIHIKLRVGISISIAVSISISISIQFQFFSSFFCAFKFRRAVWKIPYGPYGGFQLLDLIITELKSHMTC